MEFSNRFYILLDKIQGLFIQKKRGAALGEYQPTREQAKRLAELLNELCECYQNVLDSWGDFLEAEASLWFSENVARVVGSAARVFVENEIHDLVRRLVSLLADTRKEWAALKNYIVQRKLAGRFDPDNYYILKDQKKTELQRRFAKLVREEASPIASYLNRDSNWRVMELDEELEEKNEG